MPPSMSGKSGTNHHSSTSCSWAAAWSGIARELHAKEMPQMRVSCLIKQSSLDQMWHWDEKSGSKSKCHCAFIQKSGLWLWFFDETLIDFDSDSDWCFFLIAEHHPPAIHKDLEYFQVTIRSISRTREKLVAGSCMGGRKSPATCRKPLLIVPQGAVQQSVMWHCHNNNHALQSHFIFWFFNFYKFSLFKSKCKLSSYCSYNSFSYSHYTLPLPLPLHCNTVTPFLYLIFFVFYLGYIGISLSLSLFLSLILLDSYSYLDSMTGRVVSYESYPRTVPTHPMYVPDACTSHPRTAPMHPMYAPYVCTFFSGWYYMISGWFSC